MKKILITTTFILLLTALHHHLCAQSLKTRWTEKVSATNVWKEYPRPQFERSEWENLNGLWDYTIQSKAGSRPQKFDGEILVPFCIESSLSGVQKQLTPDDRLWYRKKFSIPKGWNGKDIILNFEAVDYEATVWLNGIVVGSHKGAYDRFSFDITPYINNSKEQELVVRVEDPCSFGAQPRGKQQIPAQGIFYTPVSGIWQTVWLEAVNREAYLQEVKITPDIDKKTVAILPLLNKPFPQKYQVKVDIYDESEVISSTQVEQDTKAIISIDNPKLWSPDSPFLYDVKLTLKSQSGEVLDVVDSYFGMRKISLGNSQSQGNKVLMLNNKPLFHYGTLDQGWWPDGLHTPPSDEAMKYDIEVTKQMGFNMIRKHIKVEPDRWYYHCDKMGMMVWQDMPSAMAILPKDDTGEKHPEWLQFVPRDSEDLNQRTSDAAQYELELRRMIDIHYNAPSIVMWVPFNEGWGQYATCRIADAVKALDPSRLVNAVSGWALRNCGDIYDIHTYNIELAEAPITLDRASVVGEFGGIGYPIEGHLWNPKMRNWGYQTYYSEEDMLKHYKHRFNQIVKMKQKKGLSAAVYTQTTDVEGEVNGLMTYDREVIKIPVDTLKEIHTELFK